METEVTEPTLTPPTGIRYKVLLFVEEKYMLSYFTVFSLDDAVSFLSSEEAKCYGSNATGFLKLRLKSTAISRSTNEQIL